MPGQAKHLPELPLRCIVCGSGGSGKTYNLREIVLKQYRGCWDRIYIFSASVGVDDHWKDVIKYVEARQPDEEDFKHDDYDPEALQRIINDQKRRFTEAKEAGAKKLPSMLLILDDFADNPRWRNDEFLNGTFVRLRHFHVSTIVSSQKYRVLNPLLRLNASCLMITRLRSLMDIKAIEEELSAVLPPDQFEAAYDQCIRNEAHGMIWVNLMKPSGDPDQVLCGYDKRILFDAEPGAGGQPGAGGAAGPVR
jgi:hypothetical protein